MKFLHIVRRQSGSFPHRVFSAKKFPASKTVGVGNGFDETETAKPKLGKGKVNLETTAIKNNHEDHVGPTKPNGKAKPKRRH